MLALDVKPETACRISPPLRMAYLTSSRHDLNLSGFLSLMQAGTEACRRRQTLAASLADTGRQMALELTPGTVEAVLMGREAWKKWDGLDQVMREWMFSELAVKSLYLAVECGDQIPPRLSGWTPDDQGPEQGVWRVWKTTTPPAGPKSTFLDLRSRSLRINGVDSVRRAILSEGLVTIFHGNASTMLREREAWKSVAGAHPMIPSLAEGKGDLFFQLHLLEGSPRWMPVGRREKRTGPDDLSRLFALLQDRDLLPPNLGVGDFISTDSGASLSRIGFEGHRTRTDPLGLFLETLASWHLPEIPPECALGGDHSLAASGFPSPFRAVAGQALSSMSFRDLISRVSV